MSMNSGNKITVLIMGLLTSIPLFAQSESVYSSIVGTVKDASGAAVPQVLVVATNVKTSIRVPASAATDEQGRYRIERLVAGTYDVTAERTGFRRFVREGVTISAAQSLRLEIPLQVGEVTEQVNVTADACCGRTW